MTLAPGTRVGVYEVVALLGAGGMGEVYRARDARLNRDVALKVLPEDVRRDPDRLARFQREAQVLASMTHPNIGHIYGLEEAGPTPALVLELIEGPTLADRIAQGPLPFPAALAIARQIADALDAAHEHGVIHRDLKPANIKVNDDDTVKVLDFGLAKLASPAAGGPSMQAASIGGFTASPTMSAAFTGAGVILGTAAYMAPEQARGRVVDKRADIWAFGCILFEMLTGKRTFDGTDATEMIAAVVRSEPEWSQLPASTPPRLRVLLPRCLQKDPKKRLRDIGDARFELDEALRAPTGDGKVVTAARMPALRALMIGSFVLAAAALAGVTGWELRPVSTQPPARFVVTLPPGEEFSTTGRQAIAMSPLGTHIAYTANRQLKLRALDQLEASTLRAGSGETGPFFSPDGQWVAFYEGSQLKKVSITGGSPVVLCAADNAFGASWDGDAIVFGQGRKGIMRVSAEGGTPEVVVAVKDGERAYGPQMLPGRRLLFTLMPANTADWDDSDIVVQSLDTGERKVLVHGGSDARYVATGHLLFARQSAVLAVAFNPNSLEVSGSVVPLVQGVFRPANGQTGTSHYTVSSDGTLAYIRDTGSTRRMLVWVDRLGREQPLKAPPRAYRHPRLSPDGQQVAVESLDDQRDIWVWHVAEETLMRLTLGPTWDQVPIWTPDGRRVIFANGNGLFSQAADGTGVPEALATASGRYMFPQTVTGDGKTLVLRQDSPSNDLMSLSLGTHGGTQPVVQTASNDGNADISPDGHWIAYHSNDSGQYQVYVRPFPNVGDGRWQVSNSGGTAPVWSKRTRELFYLTEGGTALMSAEISLSPSFKSGIPRQLLDLRAYYAPTGAGLNTPGRPYDVSPDGSHFLLTKSIEPGDDARLASYVVVQRWLDEVKRRVPAN